MFEIFHKSRKGRLLCLQTDTNPHEHNMRTIRRTGKFLRPALAKPTSWNMLSSIKPYVGLINSHINRKSNIHGRSQKICDEISKSFSNTASGRNTFFFLEGLQNKLIAFYIKAFYYDKSQS